MVLLLLLQISATFDLMRKTCSSSGPLSTLMSPGGVISRQMSCRCPKQTSVHNCVQGREKRKKRKSRNNFTLLIWDSSYFYSPYFYEKGQQQMLVMNKTGWLPWVFMLSQLIFAFLSPSVIPVTQYHFRWARQAVGFENCRLLSLTLRRQYSSKHKHFQTH